MSGRLYGTLFVDDGDVRAVDRRSYSSAMLDHPIEVVLDTVSAVLTLEQARSLFASLGDILAEKCVVRYELTGRLFRMATDTLPEHNLGCVDADGGDWAELATARVVKAGYVPVAGWVEDFDGSSTMVVRDTSRVAQ